jgi:hypothetical protein
MDKACSKGGCDLRNIGNSVNIYFSAWPAFFFGLFHIIIGHTIHNPVNSALKTDKTLKRGNIGYINFVAACDKVYTALSEQGAKFLPQHSVTAQQPDHR